MNISTYSTTQKQDYILKSKLNYIDFKNNDLEKIVNIIFTYRYISHNDVQTHIANNGYSYIAADIDTITLWLSRHTDLPLEKSILHLNLKAEYFNDIKNAKKPFEYRLKNEYWDKKLIDRHYDEVHFKLGYPNKDDGSKIIKIPYKGYEVQTIVHKHFGNVPVEVFAINSQIAKKRDYRHILDGSITIDFNSPQALEVNELYKDTNNYPNEVISKVYGSFEAMYNSGDIKIDKKKAFI